MTPELTTLRLSEVIFDEAIYPRMEHDPSLVLRYADSLDEIEAAQKHIVLSADHKLLDGKHRWLAYRTRANGDDPEIQVLIYPVTAPHDQLRLAAKLNSDHGWQLTDEDKCETAKTLFGYGTSYEDIAKTLSVSKTKVAAWLSQVAKDQKDKRNRKIYDMWMACYPPDAIAAAVNCSRRTVAEIIDGFGETVLRYQSAKAAASHAIDFNPPLYNVWRRLTEPQWVDNLLYIYTDPLDIVIAPYAGTGTIVDVCRKRFRRCFASDINPPVEREDTIFRHDLTAGLPPLQRWSDVRLVYLNPPPWHYDASVINAFRRKLPAGAFIALVVEPVGWRDPYVCHEFEVMRMVNLRTHDRISVPLQPEDTFTEEQITWARETKNVLDICRSIVVWQVP